VERDPRSPGGKGYTGMEALLQYVFDQAMAINAFDSNGYMLKVDLFHSECSDYQNLQSLKEKLKEDPAFYERCAAILGPHQPGITQPDPSYTGAQETHAEHKAPAAKQDRKQAKARSAPAPKDAPRAKKQQTRDPKREVAEKIKKKLEQTLGIDLPDLPATPALPRVPAVPELPAAPSLPKAPSAADAQQLLDFLLAP
jgi:hypothetical protein